MKSIFSKPIVWLLAMVLTVQAVTLWANAQNNVETVTVNWMNWTAPTLTETYTSETFPTYFTYANGASGQLTLPDSTVVNVTLTGEVTDSSCFTSSGCSNNRWASVTAGAYTSTNVPSLPPNNDMIVQTGYVNPAHTMTFSQPVQNVVMDIYSLGGVGQSAYTFDQDFVILSQDPSCNPEAYVQYCMYKDPENPKRLIGYEGNGTIQFVGTYSSITWTVTVPEYWSGFNVGVTSAGAPDPDPSPSPPPSPSPSPSPTPPPPPPGPPCSVVDGRTLMEAQWHSKASFNPLSQHWFSEKFPEGLVVGKGSRKVTLTTEAAVRDFLPQGPKSAILLSEWTNPGKKLKNSLAGQVVAAKLNLALSPGLTKAILPHGFGGPFAGMSFEQIINAADAALGWNGEGTMPSQAELDALNDILIRINKSYSTGNHRGILVCQEIG